MVCADEVAVEMKHWLLSTVLMALRTPEQETAAESNKLDDQRVGGRRGIKDVIESEASSSR